MTFAQPLFLVLALLAVPMLWLRRKRQAALGHSQVAEHKNLRSMPVIGWIAPLLFVLAWTALCVALARPLLPHVAEKRTIQTRDFIIAVDISGSMWTPLTDPAQATFAGGQSAAGTTNTAPGDPAPAPQPPTRIDAAEKAVKMFVARRQGDRVALFEFDTDTYYCWPLTDDLKIIQDKANLLNQTQGGGTNFEGPSQDNPGMGPLQAAINHFKKYGKARTKVLIMVTDGEDNISAQRMDELQAQMQAQGIRLYVLGVGDSWTSGQQVDLRTFTERMGGIVIPVGDAAQMRAGMDKIDQLEKSTVTLEKQTSYTDIFYLFLGLSVVLWLFYFATSALIREKA